MTARFGLRVYYEDTDFTGVVYHANYLKFIERGRSEWLRAGGIDQLALMQRDGIAFVARRVNADYLSPARYDDLLDVVSDLRGIHGARIALTQRVERAGQAACFCNVAPMAGSASLIMSAALPRNVP